jgi:hypothetical protein
MLIRGHCQCQIMEGRALVYAYRSSPLGARGTYVTGYVCKLYLHQMLTVSVVRVLVDLQLMRLANVVTNLSSYKPWLKV